MITWITPQVAIGEYLDCVNKESLVRERVDCIISLRAQRDTRERAIAVDLGIMFISVPVGKNYEGLDITEIWEAHQRDIHDLKYYRWFKNQFNVALRELLQAIYFGYKRIVIHCTAGIDRAPFVVAKYFVYNEYAQTISDAYNMIKKKRPQIIEHYEWVDRRD